jgi:hypothetical protein
MSRTSTDNKPFVPSLPGQTNGLLEAGVERPVIFRYDDARKEDEAGQEWYEERQGILRRTETLVHRGT